jgi:hypothetical protein
VNGVQLIRIIGSIYGSARVRSMHDSTVSVILSRLGDCLDAFIAELPALFG